MWRLLFFIFIFYSHVLCASNTVAKEADSFASSFYLNVRLNRQKFEDPKANTDIWKQMLSAAELEILSEASVRYGHELESLGFVLGQIVERRLNRSKLISKEMVQTLMDFITISGFWKPSYELVFQGATSKITKLAALKDCLNSGAASNYFFYLDSLFADGFMDFAKNFGVKGPSFSQPLSEVLSQIQSYEKELSLIGSVESVPGKTIEDFNDGETLFLRQELGNELIAEAKFEIASNSVIGSIHMSVAPLYRRYGISRHFAGIVHKRFPNIERIETLLGLKNYDLFLEILGVAPTQSTDFQIRNAIMGTPAGKLATAFGFNRLESYKLQNVDLAVVFTRFPSFASCEGALGQSSIGP